MPNDHLSVDPAVLIERSRLLDEAAVSVDSARRRLQSRLQGLNPVPQGGTQDQATEQFLAAYVPAAGRTVEGAERVGEFLTGTGERLRGAAHAFQAVEDATIAGVQQ